MEFKYHDLLSSIIVGYFAIIACLYAFHIPYCADYTVGYIAAAYVVGYLINTVGSLCESFWFLTIGGTPSDILLSQPKKKREYTGTARVRFYHTKEVVRKLKAELKDEKASTRKMFSLAKRYSCGDNNTRIPEFEAQYAFSRTLLTALFITTIVLIICRATEWTSYLIIIADLIAWLRFKDKSYYYAREVLSEYLKKKCNGQK